MYAKYSCCFKGGVLYEEKEQQGNSVFAGDCYVSCVDAGRQRGRRGRRYEHGFGEEAAQRGKALSAKTGYVELDEMLEALAAPYAGKDTYTRIKAMYDWAVNNIDYSWDGYSQDYAPAYDCFTLTYPLTYETGLPEAYPKDMIYRAYHMLTARTGVCYDWGILFAVMARYVGIKAMCTRVFCESATGRVITAGRN